MKKSLFFAMSLLVAAVTFVSCGKEKKDEPTSDVTITFTTTELSLAPGDEQRLQYTVTPAGTSVTLTWESNNTSVATVSQSGIVTAVADGEATITASYKDAKATCKVTVSSEAVYDNFAVSDWGLFGKEFVEIEGTDTVLSLTIGDVNCHLATIKLYIWCEGLVYGDGFSGAGYFINAGDVPVYVIDDNNFEQYNGLYIGGAFYIKENLAAYTCKGGALDVQKYGQWWESYLAYVADTTVGIDVNDYYEALSGATISYFNVDEDYESWNLGYITNGGFGTDDNEEIMYYANVTWLDYTSADRYYGVKITTDDEGYIQSIVKPYDVRTIEKYFEDNMPAAEVGGKLVPQNDHLHIGQEFPVASRQIPFTKFFKK